MLQFYYFGFIEMGTESLSVALAQETLEDTIKPVRALSRQNGCWDDIVADGH